MRIHIAMANSTIKTLGLDKQTTCMAQIYDNDYHYHKLMYGAKMKKCLARLSIAFNLSVLILPAQGSASDKVLNIYSSRHYEIDKELHKQFTESTGIKIKEVQVKEASQLIERLKSEGARSPADLFLTVDLGNLWRAKDAGLLQSIKSEKLASLVPSGLQDPDGQWFGITMRARVIVYNKTKVTNPDVKNYEDLARNSLKGKILVRTSNHVYNQSLVASFLTSMGSKGTEQWVKGFTANLARSPEGNDTDQIKALAAGMGEYALVNSYYLAKLMKSQDAADKKIVEKIGIIFPNQSGRGTHVNVSGVGVTKSAKNKENAMAFIEFLLSEKSQEQLAMGNNEYPVRKDVKLDPTLTAFGSPKFDQVSLNDVGIKTPEAVKVLDMYGWR